MVRDNGSINIDVSAPETANVPGRRKSSGWLWLVIILIVILGAAGYYFYHRAGSTATPDKQVQDAVTAVGKLIDLPQGETPQVLTIADASKLVAQQPFYAGASNGDIVLIFLKARKAIIYSPTKGKLINVGPVYFDNNTANGSTAQAQPSASTSPEKSAKTPKTK